MERLNIAKVVEQAWQGGRTPLYRECMARLGGAKSDLLDRTASLIEGDAAFLEGRRQPVWSVPRSRQSLVGLLARNPKRVSAGGVDRHWRAIVELERDRALHVLPLGGETVSLALEPVVLSWAAFNKGLASLYPASIARLAGSAHELQSCPDFISRLAALVAEKAALLYPGTDLGLPSLSDFASDPSGYLEAILAATIESPWAGHEHAQWHVELLPESVRALCHGEPDCRFVGILPATDRLMPPPGLARRSAPPPDQAGPLVAKAESLLGCELEIMSDPMHLLQRVERAVRLRLGVKGGVRLFRRYSEERAAAQRAWNQLASSRGDSVLLQTWIDWFARNLVDLNLAFSNPVILARMSETWEQFRGLHSQGMVFGRAAGHRTVYAHLSEVFAANTPMTAVHEGAVAYGFPVVFAWMCCEHGCPEAYRRIELALTALETDILGDLAKARVQMAAKAMLASGPRMGPLGRIPELRSRLASLMSRAGMSFSSEAYAEEPDMIRTFWAVAGPVLNESSDTSRTSSVASESAAEGRLAR